MNSNGRDSRYRPKNQDTISWRLSMTEIFGLIVLFLILGLIRKALEAMGK